MQTNEQAGKYGVHHGSQSDLGGGVKQISAKFAVHMTWFKIAGTYGGHDPEKITMPLIFVHFSCAFDRRWLNSCTF